MNKRYLLKIDPQLISGVQVAARQKCRVILYTRDRERCRDCLERMGVEVLEEFPLISGYYAQLPAGLLPKLARQDLVDYVAADIDVQTQMYIARKVANVEQYHQRGVAGKGIGIAVLDTGLFPHVDFTRPRGKVRGFFDVVTGREQPYDDNGHGTFVTGVAAGSGIGSKGRFMGIAPEADIYAVKTMDKNGNGNSANIIKGMQWIAEHAQANNIRVVSLSLGSPMGLAFREDAMVRGAEELWRRGIVVVTAAGNEGPDKSTITTPGVSSTIITVGALDDGRTISTGDDKVAEFSSRGPSGQYIKPDLVAPGVDIISTAAPAAMAGKGKRLGNAEYTTMSGTSVATPVVAGMAALLLQENPAWSPDKVKRQLMINARKIKGDFLSEGRGTAMLRAARLT